MRKGCVKPSREIRRTVVCLFLAALAALLILSCGDDNPVTPTTTTSSSFIQILSLPTTTTWEKVWGAPTGEVFLMGEDGVVFRKNGDVWDLWFVGRITDRDTTYLDTTVDSNVTVSAPDKPFISQYNGLNFADAPISGIDWGLYDIWGSSETNIYAVGYDGTVVHYDGSTWNVELTGGTSPTFLTSVWGADSTNVYACGSGGALLHFDTTWQALRTHSYHALWDVWGLSDTSVYMVGTNGTVIKYSSDDSIMTKMETGITNSLYSIWGTKDDDLYAVGWGGKILRYNGTSWVAEDDMTDFGFLSVWGTSATDIYAAGQTVLHYDGFTWSPVRVRNEPDFNDIWAGTDGTYKQVVTVGSGGHIMQSAGTDAFYSMTVNDGSVTTDFNGVGGFSDTAWFVVGDNGTILMRDESDLTNWVTSASGVSADLNGVAVLSRDLAYAVGANGTILVWDGTTWSIEFIDTGEDLNDVWVTATATDTIVCIVGNAGTAYWYDGDWHAPATSTTENLTSVTGTASGDFWAVGEGGSLLHLSNGAWTKISSGMTEPLTAIWASDADHLVVTGGSGLVFSYTISSGSIAEITTGVGVNLRSVYGFSNANYFVGGDCNHLLHYRP
jgi:photosystem II stability/assembly factor-like uncharacterized protein